MELNFGSSTNSDNSGELRPKREKKQASPGVGIALGAVMLVIGMFSGLSVVSHAHRDQTLIETGVRTEGVVSDVRIDIRRDTSSNSNSSSSKNKSSKITFVSFTAENGQEYTTKFSEKYKGGRTHISVSTKEDMGKKMTVFYDKSNPNQAVVEGKQASSTVGYIIGGGFFLFGLFIIIACARQLKKKKNEAV